MAETRAPGGEAKERHFQVVLDSVHLWTRQILAKKRWHWATYYMMEVLSSGRLSGG